MTRGLSEGLFTHGSVFPLASRIHRVRSGRHIAGGFGMPRSAQHWIRDDGQSLIEVALALPLLLMTVLGVIDAGRAFYYASAIASAAQVGAAYAATHVDTATADSVAVKVCNATGLAEYSASPVCSGLVTVATFGPGRDAVVTVTYSFRPISAYLASRLFPVNDLPLRASSTFPSLQ